MIKVSIIIPVYSIASYIEECLQSVFQQTYRNIEVIIFNDCSKDNSMQLVKTFVNKVKDVSPGSIKDTNFYQGKNELTLTQPLTKQIIYHLEQKNDLFIPHYEDIYKDVLKRYAQDFRAEGIHSYEYKLNCNQKYFFYFCNILKK